MKRTLGSQWKNIQLQTKEGMFKKFLEIVSANQSAKIELQLFDVTSTIIRLSISQNLIHMRDVWTIFSDWSNTQNPNLIKSALYILGELLRTVNVEIIYDDLLRLYLKEIASNDFSIRNIVFRGITQLITKQPKFSHSFLDVAPSIFEVLHIIFFFFFTFWLIIVFFIGSIGNSKLQRK